MRIPGFTAEASLSRGRIDYNRAAVLGAPLGLGVSPQARIIRDPVGTCYSWCFLSGGSPLQCFFACGPGQLGGPVITVGNLA
jgi:hypothetical protein